MTQSPSSLTLIQLLASSNSKSWRSSTRFAYSGSFFKLRFRLRASQSGSGLAVEAPEIVYTDTSLGLVSFMAEVVIYFAVARLICVFLLSAIEIYFPQDEAELNYTNP
jgi:hypothetical protein